MLNGVGGRTIAEAMQNVSYTEFVQWIRFRNKRGTLHTGMRLEAGFALLATLFVNSKSKKPHHLQEFMPHADEPEIDLDKAMEQWR